jgi:hypothetical protein
MEPMRNQFRKRIRCGSRRRLLIIRGEYGCLRF